MADKAGSPAPGDQNPVRASDTDRDTVAALLREALADGRLTPDEHSDRLDAVYGSKTLGELEPLTSDLPTAAAPRGVPNSDFSSPRPRYGSERVVDSKPSGQVSLAIMGGTEQSGNWTVPGRYVATAVMGGIGLDLREATFSQREVTLIVSVVMGGVEIIVPDDVEVRVNGAGVMGGFGSGGEVDAPSVIDPGAPIVHIVGLAVMGGVGVVRKKRKHQKRGRPRETNSEE